MLMYAGIRDEDVTKAKSGYYRCPIMIIRFRNGGLDVPPETLIGKTIKILSQPVQGSFMVEVVEENNADQTVSV